MAEKELLELYAQVDKLNEARSDELRWISWGGGEMEAGEPVLWMEVIEDGTLHGAWCLVEGSVLYAPEKFGQKPTLLQSDTGRRVDGKDVLNLFCLRKCDSREARAAENFRDLDAASRAQSAKAKRDALVLAGMVELHSFDERDGNDQPLPVLVRASSIVRASDARMRRYIEGCPDEHIKPEAVCNIVFSDGTHAITVIEPAYTVLERVAHVLRVNRVPEPFEVMQQIAAELERMGVFKSPFKAPPPAPGDAS